MKNTQFPNLSYRWKNGKKGGKFFSPRITLAFTFIVAISQSRQMRPAVSRETFVVVTAGDGGVNLFRHACVDIAIFADHPFVS